MCPPGTPVRDVAAAISPRLAKAALAAVVDDQLVDLSYPLTTDAAGPHRHRQEPGGAAAAAPQHGAPAGRGGDEPLSRRAVRHRSATDEGFFYDFVVDARSCPRTSRRSKQKMQELAQQDLAVRAPDVAARGGEGASSRSAASR